MDKKIFKEELEKYKKDIREFANVIHTSVNQFYDKDKPYIYHLDKVCGVLEDYGYEVCETLEDVKVLVFGAYFHDSIEDARITYNDVLKIAGKLGFSNLEAIHAAEIVYALTNEKGRTRGDRENDKYFNEMRLVKYAPFMKCCDRLANFRYAVETKSSMEKKYRQEMPEFLKRIGITEPQDLMNELSSL